MALPAPEIQSAETPGHNQPSNSSAINLGFARGLGFGEEHTYSCFSR